MSIMYCPLHDLRWDSDKKEECPACENEEPKHEPTDYCGFDRNSSLSNDTYVCNCGWPFGGNDAALSETKEK